MDLRRKFVKKPKKITFNPTSGDVAVAVREYLTNGNRITRLKPYREGSKFNVGDGADSFLRENI